MEEEGDKWGLEGASQFTWVQQQTPAEAGAPDKAQGGGVLFNTENNW